MLLIQLCMMPVTALIWYFVIWPRLVMKPYSPGWLHERTKLTQWNPIEQRPGVDPSWEWRLRAHAQVSRYEWDSHSSVEFKDMFVQTTYGNKRRDPAYSATAEVAMWSARTNIRCLNWHGREWLEPHELKPPITGGGDVVTLYFYERHISDADRDAEIASNNAKIEQDKQLEAVCSRVRAPEGVIKGFRRGELPVARYELFPPTWLSETFGDDPGAWAPLAIKRIEAWLRRTQ